MYLSYFFPSNTSPASLLTTNSNFQTVLVIKYVLPSHPDQFKYYGYASVSQNLALMLSVVVLWVAQNTSNEYEYNLTI